MAFCDISLTWKSSYPPSSIVSFTFKEVEDEDNESSEKICKDLTTESDFDEFKLHKPPLIISRENDSEDNINCVMKITCKNPQSSRVNGLLVVSESRLLEISSDTDGYLKTLRGKLLHRDRDGKDAEKKLFVCQTLFSDIYTNLSVKFLSLGEHTSFMLQCLVINVSQNPIVHQPAIGTFDMDRLMKNVAEMGDAVSDRAKDFLSTLEHYKQNMHASQMGMYSQLSQVAGSVAVPNPLPDGPPQNPAVADMFSRLQAMLPPQSSNFPDMESTHGPLSNSSHPPGCPFMKGTAGGSQDFSSSSLKSHGLPQSVLASFLGGALQQASHPSVPFSSPSSQEHGVAEPHSLPPGLAAIENSSGRAPSEQIKANSSEEASHLQESLCKLSEQVEKSTQMVTQKIETFQREVMTALDAQKADFDRRHNSLETKIQLLLDHIENK